MTDITLVTHSGLPGGTEDDRLLAKTIKGYGATVRFAVWSDSTVDWGCSPVTLVRSAWDYHLRYGAWQAWINRVARQTHLLNRPATLSWNSNKLYLRDLAAAGIPIVPTRYLDPTDGDRLEQLCKQEGWTDVVVKPAVGASAHGARRFSACAIGAEGEDHLRTLLKTGVALIQPFISAVETVRERSLVFVDREFCHAFTKTAFSGPAFVDSLSVVHYWPDVPELVFARKALGALFEPAVYARVDIVPAATGPLLMELELVEPDLALRNNEDALQRLATICVAELEACR